MNQSIEHSFKARIRNLAQEKRIDPAQLWQNLVLERFLVRLSYSKYASHFILKGGVLLAHYVALDRYTQDLDFLVHKVSNDVDVLAEILLGVIQEPVDDGFVFTNLKVSELPHSHMKYPGVRATMWSLFGKTRFQVKVDLGFGDLISPMKVSLPLIGGDKEALFESEVRVSCYPKEFIFAEKLETIVYRGVNNSRMKDFHDLYILIESGELEASKIQRIIKSVFKHRETKMEFPIRFNTKAVEEFQHSWSAHLRGLPPGHSMPKDFNLIVLGINEWLARYTDLISLGVN